MVTIAETWFRGSWASPLLQALTPCPSVPPLPVLPPYPSMQGRRNCGLSPTGGAMFRIASDGEMLKASSVSGSPWICVVLWERFPMLVSQTLPRRGLMRFLIFHTHADFPSCDMWYSEVKYFFLLYNGVLYGKKKSSMARCIHTEMFNDFSWIYVKACFLLSPLCLRISLFHMYCNSNELVGLCQG